MRQFSQALGIPAANPFDQDLNTNSNVQFGGIALPALSGATIAAIPFFVGTTLSYNIGNFVWDSVAERVGIGTGATTPSDKIHIRSSTPRIRYHHSGSNTYGTIGATAAGTIIINADVGNAAANSEIHFCLDNALKNKFDSAGFFGCGVTTPLAQFHNNGGMICNNIGAAVAGTALVIDASDNIRPQSSSERFKENIEPLPDHKWIYSLEPKKYNFKAQSPDVPSFGFIAEELDKIYPDMVFHDKEGPFSIQYDEFVPFIIAALKEQKKDIEFLADAGGSAHGKIMRNGSAKIEAIEEKLLRHDEFIASIMIKPQHEELKTVMIGMKKDLESAYIKIAELQAAIGTLMTKKEKKEIIKHPVKIGFWKKMKMFFKGEK